MIVYDVRHHENDNEWKGISVIVRVAFQDISPCHPLPWLILLLLFAMLASLPDVARDCGLFNRPAHAGVETLCQTSLISQTGHRTFPECRGAPLQFSLCLK